MCATESNGVALGVPGAAGATNSFINFIFALFAQNNKNI